MEGISVYYKPKMLGGGTKNALPMYEKAEVLYKNELKDDILRPYRGETQNEQMLHKCRSEIK